MSSINIKANEFDFFDVHKTVAMAEFSINESFDIDVDIENAMFQKNRPSLREDEQIAEAIRKVAKSCEKRWLYIICSGVYKGETVTYRDIEENIRFLHVDEVLYMRNVLSTLIPAIYGKQFSAEMYRHMTRILSQLLHGTFGKHDYILSNEWTVSSLKNKIMEIL
jgi:hypothetical protein